MACGLFFTPLWNSWISKMDLWLHQDSYFHPSTKSQSTTINSWSWGISNSIAIGNYQRTLSLFCMLESKKAHLLVKAFQFWFSLKLLFIITMFAIALAFSRTWAPHIGPSFHWLALILGDVESIDFLLQALDSVG